MRNVTKSSVFTLALVQFGALACLLVNCGGAIPPPRSDGAPQCIRARALRESISTLEAQGKLDHIARTLREAGALCPAEAAAGWAIELRTLIDLGRFGEAAELAALIEAAPRAPPDALDLAREMRKRAKPAPADARELAANGVADARAGRPADARRKLDRALAALELEAGETAAVRWIDMPDGLAVRRGNDDNPSWSSDGRWFAVRGRAIDARTESQAWLVFEIARGEPSLRLILPPGEVTELSPDGSALAMRMKDERVRVLRIPSGEKLIDVPADEWHFWPDGAKLIIGKKKETAFVYDAHSGIELAEISGDYSLWRQWLIVHGPLARVSEHTIGGPFRDPTLELRCLGGTRRRRAPRVLEIALVGGTVVETRNGKRVGALSGFAAGQEQAAALRGRRASRSLRIPERHSPVRRHHRSAHRGDPRAHEEARVRRRERRARPRFGSDSRLEQRQRSARAHPHSRT